MYYTKCALSEYEVCGCGLMNFLLHVTQCFGWIFIYKLDTYLILPNVVSNFYYRMGFRHDPKMSTRNELAPFCIIFYLTDLMILNKINPMSINWKATNIRVDKLYDGSWRYIIHHNKSVITESFTPEVFFLIVMFQSFWWWYEQNCWIACLWQLLKAPSSIYFCYGTCLSKNIFHVYMKSKYWIAFFVKTFMA